MLLNHRSVLASVAVVGVSGVLLVLATEPTTLAQSGTRSGSGSRYESGREQGSATRSGEDARPAPKQPFEQRFWDYLQSARYENWAPFPGAGSDLEPGQSPHGDFVKMFINRTAAGASKELPHGSIIIKENYDQDRKTLMAITVMYRGKGFDPQNRDWYWVKYEADGRVSEMNGMQVSGKVSMCIECHKNAKGKDLVFAND